MQADAGELQHHHVGDEVADLAGRIQGDLGELPPLRELGSFTAEAEPILEPRRVGIHDLASAHDVIVDFVAQPHAAQQPIAPRVRNLLVPLVVQLGQVTQGGGRCLAHSGYQGLGFLLGLGIVMGGLILDAIGFGPQPVNGHPPALPFDKHFRENPVLVLADLPHPVQEGHVPHGPANSAG